MNAVSDDPLSERPLLSFSLYTDVQADIIRRTGKELCEQTSSWIDVVHDNQRAYDLFWLWVLGAYALTRTLDAFNDHFSEDMKARTNDIKIYIAKLRMPFAKQQIRGKKTVAYDELSVFDIEKGMVFEIEGERFNSTDVIKRFISYLDSISFADLGVEPRQVSR